MYSLKRQLGFWPAVIAGGASLLGGFLSNRASAKQAETQMEFQRDMSGTAHQRQVADLKAAGLNPILSGTGGMGAPSGSGAMAQQHDIFSPAVSTGYEAYKSKAKRDLDVQLEKMEKENERLKKNLATKEQTGAAIGGFMGPAIPAGIDAIKGAVDSAINAALDFIAPGIPLPGHAPLNRRTLPSVTEEIKKLIRSLPEKLRGIGTSSAKQGAAQEQQLKPERKPLFSIRKLTPDEKDTPRITYRKELKPPINTQQFLKRYREDFK